jgi:hypothetical protein
VVLRRLWWTVYDYRACCCQFRHSYRAELQWLKSQCQCVCVIVLFWTKWLTSWALVRMCDTVHTSPWQLFCCVCLQWTEGLWDRFCFEYLGFPLSL